jgi:NitT/TauT family transport system substrate-binding protein
MLKSMHTFLSLCLCLCCLLISSCREKTLQPPLKIGTNKWIGSETLYLAHNLQLFDPQTIRLIEMPSATTVARALRSESLDVAALTLDVALTLMQFVPDLCIILVMDRSVGADALLAKPGIQTLAALKSKRIGVENSAVGAILLDAALRAGNLRIGDVKLVPAAVNLHEQYYLSDKVDALVTFEPYKSRLLAAGAQNLFDSRDTPGLIMDVLITRVSVVQQRETELKALIEAHFKALNHVYRHQMEAMDIIASYLGVGRDDVGRLAKGITIPGLADNRRLLLGKPPGLKDGVDKLIGMMQERQLLFMKIKSDNILNGQLLPYE